MFYCQRLHRLKKLRNWWGIWKLLTRRMQPRKTTTRPTRKMAKAPNNLKISCLTKPNFSSKSASKTFHLAKVCYSLAQSNKLMCLSGWSRIPSTIMKIMIHICFEWLPSAVILSLTTWTSMFSQLGATTDSNTSNKSDLKSGRENGLKSRLQWRYPQSRKTTLCQECYRYSLKV